MVKVRSSKIKISSKIDISFLFFVSLADSKERPICFTSEKIKNIIIVSKRKKNIVET